MKKGETSKESKKGKSDTHMKTSSSEEETSRNKDGKETKCTASKKGDKSKESKACKLRSGGKKVVVNWQRIRRRQRIVKQVKVENVQVIRTNQENKGEG